jgi:hypothetical protein
MLFVTVDGSSKRAEGWCWFQIRMVDDPQLSAGDCSHMPINQVFFFFQKNGNALLFYSVLRTFKFFIKSYNISTNFNFIKFK